MRRGSVCIIFLLAIGSARGQNYFSTDSIGSQSQTPNVYNKPLAGDSLCSSFCIVIKKEVKAHKHLWHSEHVVVMEGEAEMSLNEKTFLIKKGDVVFIPKGAVHAVKVKGTVPLKVISIQAPRFDGSDRVMVDSK